MTTPTPTEINLHRLSRVLEISFSDGTSFELPAEYLRVYSPSAEVQGHAPDQRQVPLGKEQVNIDRIEPTGNYAVTLIFDDGHDTGIYAWETLYTLGREYPRLWQAYLDELKEKGYTRKEPSA